ncbi:MAG: alpha/beta hydrolase [Chlamydiae bacterium]|nr:alpha/beta hydrolase [Chlamydiota bacterium]
MKPVPIPTALPLFYVGPDWDQGPMPTVFYFALSAKESLQVDPFCQPALHLSSYPVRVLSVDLPFHGEGFSSQEGMFQWAHAWEEHPTFLTEFFTQLASSVQMIEPWVQQERVATAGLSRGAFIASHLAAAFPAISTLLAFAPLTRLEVIKELVDTSISLLEQVSLSSLEGVLATKTLRVYIGNRDTRVGTDVCFQWVRSLTEVAYANRERSPKIEMFMKPSIGYLGHGTSPDTFLEGALWLIKQLHL